MEQKINRYIKGHMMTMLIVVLSSFLLLFLGEFFLYRKETDCREDPKFFTDSISLR